MLGFLRRFRDPDFHKTVAGRRTYGVLGGSLFVALGGWMLWVVLGHYRLASAPDEWFATPCVVERADVTDVWDSVNERIEYRIDVAYTYTAGGEPRRAARWTSDAEAEEFVDCADASRLAARFRDDANRACYVDPSNPAEAVLVRGTGAFGVALIVPLATMGLGLYIGAGMWLGRAPGWSSLRRTLGRVIPSAAPWGDRGVAIVFLVTGVLCAAGLVLAVAKLRAEVARWPAVPCTVAMSTDGFGNQKPGEVEREHWARVWYEYEVDGRRHRSDRYSLTTPHVSRTSRPSLPRPDVVDQHVASMPVGLRTTCYVDPRDPFTAVLHRESRAAYWWALLPSPLVLLGILGLIATRRQPRKTSAATAEDHFG